ncbi:hypothetical protein PPL_04934 [Heterostelium album PN500]|uniref:Uncharacterized protein n=1 Tax=Heterostelium pallidum (strain ATCC 26659 / Pp 5 / PN500) TaxID=670386 RepID=D3B8Z0_HETP5|nr:hypothetical protein PPL_04934 [Heterostelium album PN500]EFA82029.1 hypothetical protein PPL_04934 [Heterostelium album PN500]|eukprot:XP_020434146.1 hypothetical protein PPL_04934 [Heterostelium album PN500]
MGLLRSRKLSKPIVEILTGDFKHSRYYDFIYIFSKESVKRTVEHRSHSLLSFKK